MVIHRGNNDIGLKQILHRGYAYGNIFGADFETFRLFNGDSSLSNLSQNLTINGQTVAPTFIYEGKNATTSAWTATIGSDLAIAGSGSNPNVGLGTPLTNDTDKTVGFVVNGKGFQTSSATFGQIATQDFVFELVFRLGPSTKTMTGCFNGPRFWNIYTNGGTSLRITLDSDSSLVEISSSSLLVNSWYHAMFFADRSGSGIWYINGVAGTASSISSVSDTLESTKKFAIGVRADLPGTDSTDSAITWLARWDKNNWLDTHLQPDLVKERFMRLTGFYPQLAKGTTLPSVQQRNSVATLDKIDTSTDIISLYEVGAHWPRLCRRKDSLGNYLTGYLSEEARTNQISTNLALGGWSVVSASPLAVTGIGGNTTAYKITDTAINSAHVLYKTRNDTPTAGSAQTASVYAKAGTLSYLVFEHQFGVNSSAYTGAIFNLTNGTWSPYSNGVNPPITISAKNIGDGWWRFMLMANWDGVSGAAKAFAVGPSNGNRTYLGDGTGSVLVQFPQSESGSFASSAINSGVADAATRVKDELRYVAGDNIGGENPTGLTVYAEGLWDSVVTPTDNKMLVAISDGGSISDFVSLALNATTGGIISLSASTGESGGNTSNTTDLTDGIAHQLKYTMKANELKVFKDEIAVGTPDTDVGIPDELDRIDIGNTIDGNKQINGLISNVRIFKKSLPNKTLTPSWE